MGPLCTPIVNICSDFLVLFPLSYTFVLKQNSSSSKKEKLSKIMDSAR